ncbi:MAG TPA: M56 family metallopeptidase [Xanthomonadales bacterium]|nr:M56 family metallopeptidase [Xanthomonadales bacterium]
MDDVARFVTDCITSGAVLYCTCALLIVPFAAWLAVRFVVPIVRRMDGDPEWQAPLAAAAAVVPALLLLLMFATAIAAGFVAVCTRTYTGRFVFGTFIVVTAALLVRALRQSLLRVRETRALLALTVAPSRELQAVAAELGVAMRELPDSRPFCALVAALSPHVVVSSGTVAQLSHDELRAAVLHERGHARRGDHVVAALLAFVVDVFPLPARELVALYREAREWAADRHALQGASAVDLAGALLTFTRTGHTFVHLAPLDGERGVSLRLRALLDDSANARVSVTARLAVVAALGAIFAAGLLPVHAAARTLVSRQHEQLVATAYHAAAAPPRRPDPCKRRG